MFVTLFPSNIHLHQNRYVLNIPATVTPNYSCCNAPLVVGFPPFSPTCFKKERGFSIADGCNRNRFFVQHWQYVRVEVVTRVGTSV
jgi:hypothetical protein